MPNFLDGLKRAMKVAVGTIMSAVGAAFAIAVVFRAEDVDIPTVFCHMILHFATIAECRGNLLCIAGPAVAEQAKDRTVLESLTVAEIVIEIYTWAK